MHAHNIFDAIENNTSLTDSSRRNNNFRSKEGSQEYLKASVDKELEKQFLATKKGQKDNIIIDGRIGCSLQIVHNREFLTCKYNEEYDLIAGGGIDGIIKVYNSSTGKLKYELFDSEVVNPNSPVTSVRHRPVSKSYPALNAFTATYTNGNVKSWNYHLKQCVYTIKEKRQTLGLTYHPRFPKFITYGDDGKVFFYDEESKTQERMFTASEDPEKHDGHMSRVFAGCFHPRNNYELITGGWDDVVQFWDLRQPYAVRHLSGIHVCGDGIDINPKGTEVLTCAFQTKNPLRLWDYASGRLFLTLEPDIYSAKLYCGKYINKDYIITGGTDPNILRIVDLQTAATVASVMSQSDCVSSIDLGPRKKSKGEKEIKEMYRTKSDFTLVPKFIFTSGKKMYQFETSF